MKNSILDSLQKTNTTLQSKAIDLAAFEIVLYNDDVNTFDHVIDCLMKYCKHDAQQAEQCALLVHTKGKCAVKSGDYSFLQPLCDALCENGLSAQIEMLS
ncbi:MAG: ATP-dependent Clp protease adaptor ClpS [bacterium]|nr:ATP-dependent Clp protease adaptor ClpS [bacterium]